MKIDAHYDFNEIIVNVISRNKSYFKYDVENPLKGVLKELPYMY